MAKGTIIAGHTCVVTGAGSGIGRALARLAPVLYYDVIHRLEPLVRR